MCFKIIPKGGYVLYPISKQSYQFLSIVFCGRSQYAIYIMTEYSIFMSPEDQILPSIFTAVYGPYLGQFSIFWMKGIQLTLFWP